MNSLFAPVIACDMTAVIARDMTAADVPHVIALHKVCFDGYFLTALGDDVLSQFYMQAVKDAKSFAVVLAEEASGELVGLAVATLDPGFHTTLLRRHFVLFSAALIKGIFGSGVVRRGLRSRLRFIERLIHTKADSGLADAGVPPPSSGPEARFLDVAVDPDRRGGGYAELLVNYLTRRVFDAEAGRLGGSVRPDNVASLILYKRLGWNVRRTASHRVDVWIERSMVRE
jgi:ribosomal protein S18 acetylase RimI-like enzyme